MSIGLLFAAAALAQASDAPAYGPAAPDLPKAVAGAEPARKDCSPTAPDPESGAIVVCVVKPNGYRIDPDILSAKDARRKEQTGGPRAPERYADKVPPVGPQYGCMGVQCANLIGVALTAAQMAAKLANGATVGSVMKTQPEGSTEYQYYQQATAEREQKQADRAAQAYAARVAAEAAAEKAAQAEPKDGE